MPGARSHALSKCGAQLSEDMALHKSLAVELPELAACVQPLRDKYRALAKFEVRTADAMRDAPPVLDAPLPNWLCRSTLAGAYPRRGGLAA